MKLAEALKRIEELERRVKELESRPPQEIHYHTHQAPYIAPVQPYWTPLPTWPYLPGPTWAGGNVGDSVPIQVTC